MRWLDVDGWVGYQGRIKDTIATFDRIDTITIGYNMIQYDTIGYSMIQYVYTVNMNHGCNRYNWYKRYNKYNRYNRYIDT